MSTIIIAPDSFKGCLRSPQVCTHIEAGILATMPDAKIISVPLADGGEGTTEAAVSATRGKMVETATSDPFGRPINAKYGIMSNGTTAVMEMAAASGIELLKSSELNPLQASTYGTGTILRSIIDAGIRDIIIGIGGSATNDGGAGMAQALGYKFMDINGNALPCGIGGGSLNAINAIDSSAVIPQLKQCRIRVACDVTNPLLGNNGASAIYGPQKGASSEIVQQLDNNLTNYAKIIIKHKFTDNCTMPGDGAAGGLGFGLRTLTGAEIVSGAELLIETVGLREHLPDADWLITGEGCTDSQTASGKLCSIVADTAAEYNVPTILLSGAVLCTLNELGGKFKAAFSITDRPLSLDEAIANAGVNLEKQAANIAGLLVNG
ncbi:MAG: glycerate kinase [Victivallaceae bacterium]|nr:glycerate kinase [Victivallaceae bacterium]